MWRELFCCPLVVLCPLCELVGYGADLGTFIFGPTLISSTPVLFRYRKRVSKIPWVLRRHYISFINLINPINLPSPVINTERSSLPSKNFLCNSMYMLQIGALLLVGRLVEVHLFVSWYMPLCWHIWRECKMKDLDRQPMIIGFNSLWLEVPDFRDEIKSWGKN